MTNDKYRYPAEKLSAARRALMLPHPLGEAVSVAGAHFEFSIGMRGLTSDDLDDNAQGWVRTIERVMDLKGIDDPTGKGTANIRAEQLSDEEKADFSRCVDELAWWLDWKHRS